MRIVKMSYSNTKTSEMVSNIIKVFELLNKSRNINEERALLISIAQLMNDNVIKYDYYYDLILDLLESSKSINRELNNRNYDPCNLHLYFMLIKRVNEIM